MPEQYCSPPRVEEAGVSEHEKSMGLACSAILCIVRDMGMEHHITSMIAAARTGLRADCTGRHNRCTRSSAG